MKRKPEKKGLRPPSQRSFLNLTRNLIPRSDFSNPQRRLLPLLLLLVQQLFKPSAISTQFCRLRLAAQAQRKQVLVCVFRQQRVARLDRPVALFRILRAILRLLHHNPQIPNILPEQPRVPVHSSLLRLSSLLSRDSTPVRPRTPHEVSLSYTHYQDEEIITFPNNCYISHVHCCIRPCFWDLRDSSRPSDNGYGIRASQTIHEQRFMCTGRHATIYRERL